MATHDAWVLVCRLFAGGTPVLRSTLPPREVSALPVLGKAVRPTMVDPSFVLCPHCQQHRAQVWSDGRGGRICRCPDCGQVPVGAIDGAALALDEDWLRQKMRLPDVQATPIRFTDGQAKVFEALWSFKGAQVGGERIMQRAGEKSDKPIDLFKIKSKDKGKPEHEARLAAYGALVVTQQRAGLYSMPCATAVLA
ncbi:MAG TPA: hypothetical protein VFN52_06215 [Acidiferrobacteraceae bacterium]|nr:hypothetical protein [Acidiferrobacteraceae bacterium]